MKIRNSELILNYLNNRLKHDKKSEFERLLKDDPELKELLSQLQDREFLKEGLKKQYRFDSKEAWAGILERELHIKQKKQYKFSHAIVIAASIAAILLLAFILFGPFGMRQVGTDTSYTASIPDITPGRFEAQLVLSDNTILKLVESNDTSISDNKAGVYMQLENWNLKYDQGSEYLSSDNNTASLSEDCYHTIKTGPRQEFNVTLPDGTVVWLNSSTSIKYSVRPVNNTRNIELNGEAYFEVMKNTDMPFIVTTQKQRVTVTGTSFSITSYTDEDEVNTILVEGRVTVEPLLSESKPVILNPDERATLRDGELVVDTVNASLLTNWRFNSFVFENESLEKVTRKLSRWYGIDFNFGDTSLTDLHFTGVIPKYENIISAIELLTLTTDIDFKYTDTETILVIRSSNSKQ